MDKNEYLNRLYHFFTLVLEFLGILRDDGRL
jgi:hypothetical protein